jgi:hypothetical protein
VLATTRRIALETLPGLGIIDLGGSAEEIAAAAASLDIGAGGAGGPTVRLTPRGRALLAGTKGSVDPTPSKFLDTQALRVGQSTRIAHILGLSPFAEVGRVGDQLDLLMTPHALARALTAGYESDALRARIELVAPLPDTLSRMLIQASAVIGRGSLVATSAFLWIDDPDVRDLLRTRRPACELFIDPSPPGGLLIYPDVELERVVRRCRALGVEVEIDAGVARAKTSTTPPPGKVAVATPGSTPPPGKVVPESTPPPRASVTMGAVAPKPPVRHATPAEGTKRAKR